MNGLNWLACGPTSRTAPAPKRSVPTRSLPLSERASASGIAKTLRPTCAWCTVSGSTKSRPCSPPKTISIALIWCARTSVAKTIKITVDTHRLKRKLNDIWEKGELAVRPAAQAGAQVFYDEVKMRAPVSDAPHFFYGRASKNGGARTIYPFEPGDLK